MLNCRGFLILLVGFAAVQSGRGETIDEVIADLTPKVDAAVFDITILIEESGHRIGITRGTIGLEVSEAEEAVNQQLDELNAYVNQIKGGPEANSENVQGCVDAEETAVKEINKNSIELCANSEQLNFLGVELGHLGVVKGQLSKAIGVCRSQNPVNVATFRQCVESRIEAAESKKEQIKNEIDGIIAGAVSKAESCVKSALSAVTEAVKVISDSFKNCVGNSA